MLGPVRFRARDDARRRLESAHGSIMRFCRDWEAWTDSRYRRSSVCAGRRLGIHRWAACRSRVGPLDERVFMITNAINWLLGTWGNLSAGSSGYFITPGTLPFGS